MGDAVSESMVYLHLVMQASNSKVDFFPGIESVSPECFLISVQSYHFLLGLSY